MRLIYELINDHEHLILSFYQTERWMMKYFEIDPRGWWVNFDLEQCCITWITLWRVATSANVHDSSIPIPISLSLQSVLWGLPFLQDLEPIREVENVDQITFVGWTCYWWRNCSNPHESHHQLVARSAPWLLGLVNFWSCMLYSYPTTSCWQAMHRPYSNFSWAFYW